MRIGNALVAVALITSVTVLHLAGSADNLFLSTVSALSAYAFILILGSAGE